MQAVSAMAVMSSGGELGAMFTFTILRGRASRTPRRYQAGPADPRGAGPGRGRRRGTSIGTSAR
jgi:hypothetical protein